MKTIYNLRILLLFAAGAIVPGYGADVALTIMPPTEQVASGSEISVDLVAMNPGATPVFFEARTALAGRLISPAGSWPVELRATTVAAVEVAPGSFSSRRYKLLLPAGVTGQAVLQVEQAGGGALRTVLDVTTSPLKGTHTAKTALSQLASSTKAIDAVLNRTFAGRLGPNEPIYFIYGDGENSAAKFQFSFNYRLATFNWGPEANRKTSNLQLGYTQRSLWDIDASSSPFYDTSYMPELSVDTLASAPAQGPGLFTWIGLRVGGMHESNGRAGADSRSLNTLYVRPMFAIGPLDSWHLVVFPDISAYLTSMVENENLDDYRGYGRLRMVFGKNNGPSLLFAGWAGKDFDHVSYQLDLSYPIRTKLFNFESFLLLQYFNGYGESLVSFNKKSHALRFGLGLLR
jgi:phospholipase A1